MKKNSYILGGEQSGHIILGNFTNTGDGILTALKILEIMSSDKIKASKLFDIYEQYPQIKINLPINKQLNGNSIKNLNKIVKKNESENPHIRFVVRKSGTEPLIRILVEGKSNDKVVKASKYMNNEIKKIINAK